ncbi:MAG: sigma-70 family RNA polymerase sigma factor [Thermoguttaceae bacterium]
MTTRPSAQQACPDRREPLRRRVERLRRRARRLASIDTRQILTPQQLDELWTAYMANRSNLRLRNRLVEHYLPWIRRVAISIAHRMGLHDKENAIGEVLAALVGCIIPDYDGKRSFNRWARMCIRRKAIDQWRAERKAEAILHAPRGARAIATLEMVPDREQPGCDLKFLEIAAELDDRQATVLWLRYYRGMSVNAVAAMLKVSAGLVARVTYAAVTELRKTWSGKMKDDLPAY